MWTLVLIALSTDATPQHFLTFDNRTECMASVVDYYVIGDKWYTVSEVCI